MTSTIKQTSRTPTTKKLLIGVLAVVLCFVIWNNFLRNGTSKSPAFSGEPATANSVNEVLKPRTAVIGIHQENQPEQANRNTLPAIDIESIVLRNPFAKAGRKPKFTSTLLTSPNLISEVASPHADPKSENAESAAVAVYSLESSTHENSLSIESVGIVSAIVTGGSRPAALIDDHVYYENDRVGEDWRIREIRSSGILLEAVQ